MSPETRDPDAPPAPSSPAAREAALATVRDYLERFFKVERDIAVSADEALLTVGPHWRERWKTAQAFRLVMREDFPPGTLKSLVDDHTSMLAPDDDHARETLHVIFTMSSLHGAVDHDELD
ncbi:hypothetical protein JGU66_25310 [Myxococcaceae bacterium JPH2]|nr:hypothetical protein [Myxococcaceae bacterium JPH2]